MDLNQAECVIIAEMDKWGLIDRGWNYSFHSKVRALGTCDLKNKEIQINHGHAQNDDEDFVTDTIRHEIAHALHYLDYVDRGQESKFRERKWTGSQWKRTVPFHGWEWQMWAMKVGATPKASARGSKMNIDTNFKWTMVVTDGDTVESINGYKRFPSSIRESTYLRGRKRATLGNIFVADTAQLERVKRNPSTPLDLYRGNPNRPVGRSYFANIKG